MKDYIEYFTGLQRSYGVCKVDDGYIDEITGKKNGNMNGLRYPLMIKIMKIILKELDQLEYNLVLMKG
jgi:hypothetical protein